MKFSKVIPVAVIAATAFLTYYSYGNASKQLSEEEIETLRKKIHHQIALKSGFKNLTDQENMNILVDIMLQLDRRCYLETAAIEKVYPESGNHASIQSLSIAENIAENAIWNSNYFSGISTKECEYLSQTNGIRTTLRM